MKIKLKLNRFVPLILVVGTGLLATGCGSTTPSATNSVVPFNIWRYNQSSDAMSSIINQFQSSYSKYNFVYQNNVLSDNYETSSIKAMASLSGPDIWEIPNTWIGDDSSVLQPLPSNYFYSSQNKVNPTPAQAVAQLYPKGIAEQITSPSGQVYGVPSAVDSLVLYYNPAVFQSAINDYQKSLGPNVNNSSFQPVYQLLNNPPATWSNLVDQAQYVNQRNGNSFSRSLIALGTADNVPNSNQILQLMMMQDGATIISSDHKSVLFNDIDRTVVGSTVRPGEKALAFYTSFSDPTKANYSWNNNMPNALDAFGNGELAMVIGFSSFGQQLKIKYPHLNFSTAPVPQIYSGAGQNNVNFIQFSLESVPKTSQNQKLAFTFLQSYTSQNSLGNIYQQQNLQSPFLQDLQNAIQLSIGQSGIQANQILTGKAVYEVDRPQFDADFRQMIVDVSQNNTAPGVALDSAAQKINALLSSAIITQ